MRVSNITGGGDQCERAFHCEQLFDFWVLVELGSVATSELLKPSRIVFVPLAQLCRRSQVWTPGSVRPLGTAYAPRPQTIDKDPGPIMAIRFVIETLH